MHYVCDKCDPEFPSMGHQEIFFVKRVQFYFVISNADEKLRKEIGMLR